MGFFDFGRSSEGFPSQYHSDITPVLFDVVEILFLTVFLLILIAFVCIIPGYSKKRSIYVTIKISFSLIIGCFLLLENFGQEWEVGSIETVAPYKAGSNAEIDSVISVKIGLRSVNITLKGKGKNGELQNEIINYNERFSWTWDQGRFGFGPYSGLIQRSLRSAQRKGLPIPILWVAEYFVIDGEGIRFGRFYRTAGWYCHILLWAAFSCWIVSNIMLQSVSRYAAYLIGLVGGLQILTCILWSTIRNETPLVIPFENETLTLHFGLHFWMSVACGIFCIILALIIIFMDLRYPDNLSEFLGIDPLDQYDECLLSPDEIKTIAQNKNMTDDTMEMASVSDDNLSAQNNRGMMLMKRRSGLKYVQKDLIRNKVPVKLGEYEDISFYQNL
ncbi:PREDICTED: dual oxidase maturation factor 1-like [Polistes dominula]|uniref:Dual oxidase maturation factor 1-like n=1 Tax=Polistes dominula TaxID=743375 RepID=A0ABM1IB13_POLDO|nr:PREDICTED: dual oxidase maturation factor 1-like [Polistes dominula]